MITAVHLEFCVTHAQAEAFVDMAEASGGQLRGEVPFYDARKETRWWYPSFEFDDLMKAAIFLATISADPERAAMFKMFWSGE